MKNNNKPVLVVSLTSKLFSFVLAESSRGKVVLKKTGMIPLRVNPLVDDVDVVGCELKEHLDKNGISDSSCILCLSLDKLMLKQWSIPDIDDEELQDYVEVQVEQDFGFGDDELAMDYTTFIHTDTTRSVVALAALNNSFERLKSIVKASGLKLISASCGCAELSNAVNDSSSHLILSCDAAGVNMTVGRGDELFMMRQLTQKNDITATSVSTVVNETVRQLKISFSQLPPSLVSEISSVDIYGDKIIAEPLFDAINTKLPKLSVELKDCALLTDNNSSEQVELKMDMMPDQISTAANYFAGKEPAFELVAQKRALFNFKGALPSSKIASWATIAGAVAVLVLLISFISVKWELSSLRSQSEDIAAEYRASTKLKSRVKYLDRWFSTKTKSLDVLKEVTLAFPESGSVWATSFIISEDNEVEISGKATSQKAWLEMQENLRRSKSVKDLMVRQSTERVNDREPVSFGFRFYWVGG